jgi:L-ascorbate metabolism protein UlaG (beta-lactamase superfamily)
MPPRELYLRPNLTPEPLIGRWYAWPHLISPATAAMNILQRHLPIMDSYVKAPGVHRAAVKNPRMLGGPFMDLDGRRVDDIRALRDETLAAQEPQLEFAHAILELDAMLQKHDRGYSLEPLYEKVPERLRGYVELVYDLNHAPSFRFFESLLYKSPCYDPEHQGVQLFLQKSDHRPFLLSTPRLDRDDALLLERPFCDPVWDDLFRTMRTPREPDELAERLHLTTEQRPLFESFFSPQAPAPCAPYTGPGARVRYFGHACILVETAGISVLTDPVISYDYHADIPRYTNYDLPEVIDYLLITHNHQDHILFETLLHLRHKTRHVVVPRSGSGQLEDPSLKQMFRAIGFDNVIELDEMESVSLPGLTLTGIPFLGEHGDLNIRSKLCYHVNMPHISLLFVADSRNVEPRIYEHVHRAVGDVDVLFLGMECDGAPLSWLYGPLLADKIPHDMDGSRRLGGSNYEQGIDLVRRFSPQDVFVYAMGQEPWLEYICSLRYTETSNPIVESNRLLETCRQNGVRAERLFGERELLYTHRETLACA